MSIIQYPNSSAYATTPQLSWRIGVLNYRAIVPANGDSEITITAKYANRPDRLSNDLYGTQNYWWIFMVRNMNVIRDPMYDLTVGKKIWVPTLAALQGMLGS